MDGQADKQQVDRKTDVSDRKYSSVEYSLQQCLYCMLSTCLPYAYSQKKDVWS